MTSHFSFSFSGDDIEDNELQKQSSSTQAPATAPKAKDGPDTATESAGSAFPVQGKPLLPATRHDLGDMLSKLPSKIAYNVLEVDFDGKGTIRLPRRELWDVRVQLMVEDEEAEGGGETEAGLGQHDVKTGIYEGGFKSWESSVDLVKVLASEDAQSMLSHGPCWLIELGCGTALPSLAMLQWASAARARSEEKSSLTLTLADYNPSVLYLVTLPNIILAWALQHSEEPFLRETFLADGELELTSDVIEAFRNYLSLNHITVSFMSGGWSPEFVDLLYQTLPSPVFDGNTRTLVLGAETIYSPFALSSFADTLLSILRRERADRPSGQSAAIVAAKRLYFGVGGSLDDFVEKMRNLGSTVDTLREETDGVRRGVVRCNLP